MRTHWHDLIEHHCPRYGQTRLVAIPINNPGPAEQEVQDYRMQFSFDGEGWLACCCRGAAHTGNNVEQPPDSAALQTCVSACLTPPTCLRCQHATDRILTRKGDRILTPWLTVLGRGVDGMPLVDMQLRRAGDELRGVKAQVCARRREQQQAPQTAAAWRARLSQRSAAAAPLHRPL
jgi:hypothetical protein